MLRAAHSALILRRPRSGRLEGWPQARSGHSWFETREDALLTMRSGSSIHHLGHGLTAHGRVGIADSSSAHQDPEEPVLIWAARCCSAATPMAMGAFAFTSSGNPRVSARPASPESWPTMTQAL